MTVYDQDREGLIQNRPTDYCDASRLRGLMGFASLGSGSRGNGTLVFLGEKLFLVDCGFSLKQAERLARLELVAETSMEFLLPRARGSHQRSCSFPLRQI